MAMDWNDMMTTRKRHRRSDAGARFLEELRSQFSVLTDDTQEDAFRSDLGRAEMTRFVSREEDYATRFFSVAFKHDRLLNQSRRRRDI
jgi:hypothetical protein